MAKPADPGPDGSADPANGEASFDRDDRRLRANARRRQLRAEQRRRFVYPPLPLFASAAQTASAVIERRPPLLPWAVEMTVRLRTPDSDYPAINGSTMQFDSSFATAGPLPFPKWASLSTAFDHGVRRALSGTPHPWPEHGYRVELVRLHISPPPATITLPELTRLAELVEAMAAGAVTALLGGLIAAWQRERYLNTEYVRRDMADFET